MTSKIAGQCHVVIVFIMMTSQTLVYTQRLQINLDINYRIMSNLRAKSFASGMT